MMLYNEFSLNLKNIEVETIIAYAEQEESRRFLLTNNYKIYSKINTSSFLLKKQ